jgi:hypothetical protein
MITTHGTYHFQLWTSLVGTQCDNLYSEYTHCVHHQTRNLSDNTVNKIDVACMSNTRGICQYMDETVLHESCMDLKWYTECINDIKYYGIPVQNIKKIPTFLFFLCIRLRIVIQSSNVTYCYNRDVVQMDIPTFLDDRIYGIDYWYILTKARCVVLS